MTTLDSVRNAHIPEQRDGNLWDAMPGWGISADLTPPELIAARRLRRVRRRVVVALTLVVVLCVAAWAGAAWQDRGAAAELAGEQQRTSALQSEAAKYSAVVRVQGATTLARQQIATLMADDVDLGAVLRALSELLPDGMTITQLGITLDHAGPVPSGTPADEATLDLSGLRHIGSITVSGTALSVNQLPGYVEELASVRGFVAPLPLTNSSAEAGVTFSVQVTLTEALLTHRYDQAAK